MPHFTPTVSNFTKFPVKQAPDRQLFRLAFHFRQDIVLAGYPYVERRQQVNSQDQRRHQAAHNNDGEGALRIRANAARKRRRQQAEAGDQHSHHDRAQTLHRTINGCFKDVVAPHAQLIDVFQHDDPGLHGHAKERQESDAR